MDLSYENFGQQLGNHHMSAVEILRKEREERIQRLKRQRPDDDTVKKQNKQCPNYTKLPPGWLDCPSFGQAIVDCIVPSKVPLDETFNDCVPPGKRYSFRQVIHQQRVLKREVGMVIDLTNTTRYYSFNDLRKQGIGHVKIRCQGRDSVPDNESVNLFVYEVSQFLTACNTHGKKKYILVHCTHGHNRTGFMIVHYLMRVLPVSVTQAIRMFSDARPPGIYKPDYIDALYRFYNEEKPGAVVCPSTPEWKRSELDLNGDAVLDDDGDPVVALADNCETRVVMSNDDILGDAVPQQEQNSLRKKCYQLLEMTPKGRGGGLQFPGTHPVSLDRDNLQFLRQRYYYATWKADGTRYMMLITRDSCYLIDRHFNFRRVQMRFPYRRAKGGLSEKNHCFTLLDGEMIIDTFSDAQKQEEQQQLRRYLIYDMMALNDVSIIKRPFSERWEMIEKEVIGPRNHERACIKQSRNPYYRYDSELFRVRRKKFWPLCGVERILNENLTLPHKADGLIFQGWHDPYNDPDQREFLLKWKYPEMNSVDFLFEVVDGHENLYLQERGEKKLMEGNRVVFPDGSDPSDYSGKIIECCRGTDDQEWVWMRTRVDKGTPNAYNTYKKVVRSIKDNITTEVLLNEVNEIKELPMYTAH